MDIHGFCLSTSVDTNNGIIFQTLTKVFHQGYYQLVAIFRQNTSFYAPWKPGYP